MATPELEFSAIVQRSPGLQETSKGPLRFTTAGSVDDGKSTLIGRLLYDSQSVYEDQIASIRKSRINRSGGPIDLSLLTDGLRAEREQGITIDVAYRYFSTPRRQFIIADTPGHEQYTRNMATGASTADLAIVLLDATKGVLPQTRRHLYIAGLLGMRHIVGAVNKMDLADYASDVFERIAIDFRNLADKLGITDAYVVPMSALAGDNVVSRGTSMPWFHGPTLLEHLENVEVHGHRAADPVRLPIQRVVRPDSSFRGFAGQLASGTIRPGSSVIALPSGVQTRVNSIVSFDGNMDQAGPGSSITVTLEKDIDISRGDMLAANDHLPTVSRRFHARLVWMDADDMDIQRFYLLKHTTRTVRVRIKTLAYRVDVNTYEHLPAPTLCMNDIGSVKIESTQALFFDAYVENRTTGSFILIDPLTNATVAAGMIDEASTKAPSESTHSTVADADVTRGERVRRFGHPAAAIWISGPHRIAKLVERHLFDDGWLTHWFDISEFSHNELRAVARGFAAIESVLIFSSPAEDTVSMSAVQAAFPRGAFFHYSVPIGATQTIAHTICENLRRWRDANLGAAEDQQ